MHRSFSLPRATAASYAAVFSVALMAALGCSLTPLAKRTSAFAAAAGKTATSTSEAYTLVNRATYQAQVASLVLHYDDSGFDPNKVEPFLRQEDLKVRRDLLKGLLQYAELLADVSSDRPVKEVDEQAKAVGSSIKSLTSDQLASAKFTSAELNGVTAALDALGRVLINNRRRRELPGILRDMRQPIITICTLLHQDIGDDPLKSGLRNQLHVVYADLIERQEHYIDDNEDHLSPTEKRSEIRTLPQIVVTRDHADAALAATSAALADLAAAHSALADTANQKNAPAFQVRLSELIIEVEHLDDFYNSLPTK